MTAQLHVIQPEANQSVIELLEHYLKRAEAGEFASMVVVYLDRDGCTASTHSYLPSVSAIIGAMERAKWDIIQECDG